MTENDAWLLFENALVSLGELSDTISGSLNDTLFDNGQENLRIKYLIKINLTFPSAISAIYGILLEERCKNNFARVLIASPEPCSNHCSETPIFR